MQISLIKTRVFLPHVLRATCNSIGIEVQKIVVAVVALDAFERALEVDYMAQLKAPCLWLDHELGEFKVLGSGALSWAA